jgi:hypothetical protein
MRRTIEAMVTGRRRWLERMQRAKAQGLIDKIPTGRRRPRVRAGATKAIASARGIASGELEARSQIASAKRFEDMSLPELIEELCRMSFERLLAILDRPAGDNLELQHLQAEVSLQLLRLGIR